MITPVYEDTQWPRLDLVRILFLVSVFLAPLELGLVAAFTIYDLVVILIAILILIGPHRLQFLPNRILTVIYTFLVFAYISTFRAPYPFEALTQLVQFVLIFFIQLPVILTIIKSKSMLQMSLIVFVGAVLISNVSAMILNQSAGAGRLIIFYSDNPNRLGYPTAYLLPFVLYFLFENVRRRRFLFTFVLAIPAIYIFAWGLTASGSRSSTLGMVVALVVFLGFRKGLYWKTPFHLFVPVILVLMIGTAIYQTDFLPITLRRRIERTLMFEDTLVNDRLSLAVAGWQAFLESPFVGIGLDNFRYVARQYESSTSNQPPHNLWIQFLAQTGLFGALSFMILLLYWLALMFRAQQITVNPSQRELFWAFIASMAAILTIYMFVPILIQRHYWLLYGLGLVMALELKETRSVNRLRSGHCLDRVSAKIIRPKPYFQGNGRHDARATQRSTTTTDIN